MTSPIFHPFVKRFVVQVKTTKDDFWQNGEAFGSLDAAERYLHHVLKTSPHLSAGRIFDQVSGQAGNVIYASQ
ncbi:MAG: hypothetical protein KDJ52_08075 [Anaerolineae bacterium]|nr:hypothetical protein [Anaerolineae bacterium]